MKRGLTILLALLILMGMTNMVSAASAENTNPCLVVEWYDVYFYVSYYPIGKGHNYITFENVTDYLVYSDDGSIEVSFRNLYEGRTLNIYLNDTYQTTLQGYETDEYTSSSYFSVKAGECVTFKCVTSDGLGNYDLYLNINSDGTGDVFGKAYPESFSVGQCPSNFFVLIETKNGTDSFDYYNVQGGCYYINKTEVPIAIRHEMSRCEANEGSAAGLMARSTGIDMMNQLPAGKYEIWIEYDRSEAITTTDNKRYYLMTPVKVVFTITNPTVPSTGDSTSPS